MNSAKVIVYYGQINISTILSDVVLVRPTLRVQVFFTGLPFVASSRDGFLVLIKQ
jgi:hypothetical protein